MSWFVRIVMNEKWTIFALLAALHLHDQVEKANGEMKVEAVNGWHEVHDKEKVGGGIGQNVLKCWDMKGSGLTIHTKGNLLDWLEARPC